MSTNAKRGLHAAILAFLAGALLFATGCQFGQAVIDGAYGGISDTVAGAISDTLLRLLGSATLLRT
jgi:hypothetical protein